jgi:hypothetical protein
VKEAEAVPNPVLLLACDEIIDNLQENLASFPLYGVSDSVFLKFRVVSRAH